MVDTRRVWRTDKAGAIRRLQQREEPVGALEPGKMRVATRAVGLNFADIFALTGLYSATPGGSFIPGLEFSGTVQDAGESRVFAKGDSIMGVIRFGAYATTIDVDPQHCLRLPPSWSFAEGAGYLAQTITALYALKTLGDAKAGQVALIQSAAGGVGLQAMRLCRKLNVVCVGAVGNESKKAFLQQQGFSEVIVRGSDFREDLRRLLSGRELHLVLDAVGGRFQKDSFALLAPTGRLIVFGAAEFTPGRNRPRYLKAALQYLRRPRYDPLEMISTNKSVMGFNLIWLWERIDLFQPLLRELQALDFGAPHVGREFPFLEAHEAIEFLRSGLSTGKVVLIV